MNIQGTKNGVHNRDFMEGTEYNANPMQIDFQAEWDSFIIS